jgi:hypothetical protein
LVELGRLEDAEAALEDYISGLTTYTTLDWVMFYWPYQHLNTAERLARSFAEAGLPATPQRYNMTDVRNRLRGDEIVSLLSGKTMIGVDKSYFGGDEFQTVRDVNVQIVNQDFLTYFDEGESQIHEDSLCDPWHTFGDYCVAIYRNPRGSPATRDEYVFFTLMNTFTFSVIN